jgi:uncharacterized protein (TIGR03435 family)
VVSIKQNRRGNMPTECLPPDGAKCRRTGVWRLGDLPVTFLIRDAYGSNDIVGGPGWVRQTRFDYAFEVDPKVPDSDFRQMLRQVLADRFHLIGHLGQRQGWAVPLRVAPGGTKIRPASAGCIDIELIQPKGPVPCGGIVQTPRRTDIESGWLTVTARSVTMDDFVAWLHGGYSDFQPALNETNLPGRFDLDFKFYVPPPPVGDQNTAWAINRADVERGLSRALEDLGLIFDPLHPVKRALPTFVIDRILMPAPN